MLNRFTCWSIVIAVVAGLPAHVVARQASTSVQAGHVFGAEAPVYPARVTLYQAGASRGSGAVVLGSARTQPDGSFTMVYPTPSQPDVVLYLVAQGHDPATILATVLGGRHPAEVVVNERTTVATAYCMAQFLDGIAIGGNATGLRNAAATFRNLVDLGTGDIASMLGNPPNGADTDTLPLFNSLANMLAGCIDSPVVCDLLFALATPPGGSVPGNTLDAAANIARHSWQNPVELFQVSLAHAPFQPALTLPPVTWTLALKYVGNGHEFDGPGAIAFDADGNAWINNNYNFAENHARAVCASATLSKLTPDGRDFPGAPYDGTAAGLSGAGFGISVDPFGNVWVGNFGFFGSTCPCGNRPLANSVSAFDAAGQPLSPATGFTYGCIGSPQATVSDQAGNIWIANACNGTVTRYPLGNPQGAWVHDEISGNLVDPALCPPPTGASPFGIAIDSAGNGWVTDNNGQVAFKLSPDGAQLAMVGGPGTGIVQPMGIAVDSQDNAWVANSGIVHMPCSIGCLTGGDQNYGDLIPDLTSASVTKLDKDGNVLGIFQGAGLWIPWGIAVDGADNVWVANFGGNRVSAFDSSGTPIAPNGFHSDALTRITGLSVDASGNLWLANNWLPDPVQTNPGGDGVVVFIGLAAPVKTPLLGPPRQP